MSHCDERSTDILLHLDNVLTGQRLEDFCAHLAGCSNCRERLLEELTLTPVLPASAPCNWSSLPGVRKSLQAFGQSIHCQDEAECQCYVRRSGSFRGSLRSSIGSAQSIREQRSEFGSRSTEARHHCASRAVQQSGYLLVGQLFILAQHDNLAKLLGKLLDRLSHLIALHFAHIKSMWILRRFHGQS